MLCIHSYPLLKEPLQLLTHGVYHRPAGEREFHGNFLLKYCGVKHSTERAAVVHFLGRAHNTNTTAQAERQGDIFLASSAIGILVRWQKLMHAVYVWSMHIPHATLETSQWSCLTPVKGCLFSNGHCYVPTRHVWILSNYCIHLVFADHIIAQASNLNANHEVQYDIFW